MFKNGPPQIHPNYQNEYGTMYNPNRIKFSRGNERTIITSVYNRICLDAASVDIKHIRLDKDDRYESDIDSKLNQCLTVEANIDQTARAFLHDIVASLLDEACIAVVPVDTTSNPVDSNAYDILSMRTGRITDWYPSKVTVELYNDATGHRERVTLPKSMVAIIENPLSAVINEPNSTMQRLISKLGMLDAIDRESSSGNLNLLVQLPYAVKTAAKKEQAEERRRDLEEQLTGNRYGIGYIDSTEHVTQLNRPLDNNLMKQIEYLTNLLYSQLGLTQGILDGTADENTMNNYFNRTIEPIIGAIVDEFHRKFLSKTARAQKQAIQYFRDPFKLVPVNQVSEMADKFTRNEILSSNEFRQIIGRKPSKDPAADELRNKNLSQSKDALAEKAGFNKEKEEEENKKDVKE